MQEHFFIDKSAGFPRHGTPNNVGSLSILKNRQSFKHLNFAGLVPM